MENRSVRQEDRKESSAIRKTELDRQTRNKATNGASPDSEELKALIEFFQLLDGWDRQEVVQ